MEPQFFLDELKEVLELDIQKMNLDDNFREYEEWDSLTFLSLITYIRDEYGILLDIDSFNQLTSWRDLYNKVNQ